MANRSYATKQSQLTRKQRWSRRQLLLQQLERRELFAANTPMPVWAPGTPQSEVDDFFNNLVTSSLGDPILQGSRWTNPVGGPSPNQGDPARVTWSVVPDGTTTVDITGGTGPGSDLISYLDGIYGGAGTPTVSAKPWFPILSRAYDLWSATSGVFFIYEPADDGLPMNAANRGVAGVRGDARIGGGAIDGSSGILAFNFYPTGGGNTGFDGDMIVDTSDDYYILASDGPGGENRGLVNVLTHEGGHGIGIAHSMPTDGTKLMEPFLNEGFYGTQLDDIINSNRLYGDKYEAEERATGAVQLGVLPVGVRGIFDLSIDHATNVDLFQFDIAGPRKLSLNVSPIGRSYLLGPQGGTPVPTDTLRYSNLKVRVLADDKTTVIAEQDLGAIGESEILTDVTLPQGGTYYVEVSGTEDAPQLYEAQLQLTSFANPGVIDANAPRLISINPNAGEIFDLEVNNQLGVSPSELTFRFDGGQRLDPNTLQGIRITRSGGDGTFGDGNEEIVQPGYLGFGDSERIVIARFANPLVDDQYQIEIFGYDLPGAGIVGLRNIDNELFQPEDITSDTQTVLFEVEIGAVVTAVVPQPIEIIAGNRVQQRNQIHVYFNEDPLSDPAAGPIITGGAGATTVVDPKYYQLFYTAETVENTDDAMMNPSSITYDPAINRAVLTFASDLSEWAPVAATMGAGTLRLRVGSSESLPTAPSMLTVGSDETLSNSPGDTFVGARALGTLLDGAGKSVVIDSQITPVRPYLLQWPGASDTAGVRDVINNSQLLGRADTTAGITTLYYNFKQQYGDDTQGNRLSNAITEAQKQRFREVLDLYERALGVRFVESDDRGLHFVTGDMRAVEITADVEAGGNLSIFRSDDSDPGVGLLILDGAENWYDGYGQSPDTRPSFFLEALRQVGSLLGIGDLFDRPPGTAAGSESELAFNLLTEPDFLSQSDITLGQYLYRPESHDVDLYKFSVATGGRLTAETFAERLTSSSLLDTSLTLWRKIPGGGAGDYELVARNDDFYSNDSFVGLDLLAGDYVVGVSASGNDSYNPTVANSGLGGRSEGRYQLRLGFESTSANTILDADGTPLDGDADGIAGGNYNFWFRTARNYDGVTPLSTTIAPAQPRILFVDKYGTDSATRGTVTAPLRTIDEAMRYAFPGDIIRVLPNTGADGRFDTLNDNRAYEIGKGGVGNLELTDGLNLDIKQGVTVMVDSGVILKLRGAQVSVGSSAIDTDRSLSALQVLGTPIMVSSSGAPLTTPTGSTIPGRVIFTSYDDQQVGFDTNPLQTTPASGQWGGISFRNDVDYAQGRPVSESEGIFLNYVGQADIRYGGGAVGPRAVAPVEMNEARPAIKYSIFRQSADAALSADPNSFEETNFHAPEYQRAASFTSDYDRVGPDLAGIQFVDNSINGLFIRIDTPTAGQLEPMTVSGRFDDTDITHVLSQQLILQGTPGGPQLQTVRPSVLSVTSVASVPAATSAPSTLAAGTYNYRMTFVDIYGSESLSSLATTNVTAAAGNQIRLAGIPSAPGDFVGRRLYRLNPTTGEYEFVTQLNRSQSTYTDRGMTRGGILDFSITESFRPRYDARLSIDPGIVVKSQTSRIEATFGADFYAEGVDGREVIFTSKQDDRYGAGGTFDTNNDGIAGQGGASPVAGEWGGLVFGQGSTGSLDYALITFAGGNALIEGSFANFNPIEILQGKVRVAHSTLENNASGLDGDLIRGGRGFNDAAAIFVRGAQPVIYDNIFRDNAGAAISINPDALNFYNVTDWGRGIGDVDSAIGFEDNQGPLIRNNRLSGNDINGLKIRPEVLTTESVWDDSDIVHVVAGDVIAVDQHYVGGLRLESSPAQSLVVKFETNARLLATGRPLDIDDRIGGTLQVVGQPGFPVILTSLRDDSVGAGFTPDGRVQTDTDNAIGAGQPGDWQGLSLDVFANDRNVQIILENEPALATAAELNAIPGTSQFIGVLAKNEKEGDENERLGFEVQGTLSDDGDVDVYKFAARGGTEVWIDIDRTTYALDSVVELIDQNGNILVLSDDTFIEQSDPSTIYRDADIGNLAFSLNKSGAGQIESPNERDAGFRVVLPGSVGEVAEYFVRVRSSNIAPGDASTQLLDTNKVRDGLSRGAYRMSIRLREIDEVAGSTVQFADIRYAVNGIDLVSSPLHSPLAGEAAERLFLENGVLVDRNNAALTGPAGAPDVLGNLLSTDRAAISVSGRIGNQSVPLNPGSLASEDFDMFEFDLTYDSLETAISRPDGRFVPVTFDVDYADGIGRVNTSLSVYDSQFRLILTGRDSNISGDQGSPLRGVDSTNLTAGSAGVLDAHIGPVELPEGKYYVVVHSDMIMPSAFDQFTNPNSLTPLVRVMPVNSVRTVASDPLDDHLVPPIFPLPNVQPLDYTADKPLLEPAFDTDAIVPFTLGDVNLFVAFNGGINGGTEKTTMALFDPFTGTFRRTFGETGPQVGDIMMRSDGELYSYTQAPQTGASTRANVGNYINISTQNAAILSTSDDAITFRRSNANFDGTEDDPDALLIVNAMDFAESFGVSFTVGTRNTAGRGGEVVWRTNVMYANDITTGATYNGVFNAVPDRDFLTGPYNEFFGPASQKIELGVIDTGGLPLGAGLSEGTGINSTITGIAVDPRLASNVFAVDNQGGVYEVNLNLPSRTVNRSGAVPGSYNSVLNTDFLGQITAVPEHTLGTLRFSGLTTGPANTEGGAYSQLLFATTQDGWIYAININETGVNPVAEPAFVFAGGKSAIQMVYSDGSAVALPGSPVGLAFSTYDENAWHQTNDRRDDPGHGLQTAPDNSRGNGNGGNSLYFGFEPSGDPAENTLEFAEGDTRGTLAPGGSFGSIMTQPFSLEGYSSADKPTAYFSYFLETENVNASAIRDSFRVFAAGDDGVWQLLATNNSLRNPGLSDEYDYFGQTAIAVQELHDNTDSWRQARMDLSPLAGNKLIRLRFDFSTAGGMGYNAAGYDGYRLEIMAVPGNQLKDGDTLEIVSALAPPGTPPDIFEVDLGYVIDMPSGNEITIGDSFDIVFGATTQTITFTNGPAGLGQASINANMTSSQVADAVLAALNPGINGVRFGVASVGLTLATNVINNAAASGVVISGTRGIDPASDFAITVEGNLSVNQVATRLQEAFVIAYGTPQATADNFKSVNGRVTIHQFLVTERGPFGATSSLPGDEFGTFQSNRINNIVTAPAQNNEVEGVYVDDLIIGFAERGEMVLGAPQNQGFISNPESDPRSVQPERPDEILTGAYNLEIRTSAQFGVSEDAGALLLNEDIGLGRSFDTNDRLEGAVTIVAQSGGQIRDGDTFVISDGTRQMTFEFDSIATPGFVSGRVPVMFDPRTSLASDVAASIRDAINSQQVQLVLNVRAQSGDSLETGPTTSNRVELFGDNLFINPSIGRNLKVDLVSEENFNDRVNAQTFPQIPVPDGPVDYVIEPDMLARALPTQYLNGATDTLVAVGKIGDRALSGTSGEILTTEDPRDDVDTIKIHLYAGNVIDIDLDAVTTALGVSRLTRPLLIINDIDGNELATSLDVPGATVPGESVAEAFIRFTAPADGYYYVSVLSQPPAPFLPATFGEYQLTIRPASNRNDVLYVDYQMDSGDQNRFRDQGQILISSNFITDSSQWGIRATASNRDRTDISSLSGTQTPKPGTARILRNENSPRMLPGSVISNNVIVGGGSGGILFAGDASVDGQMPGSVPFGRIVNNTVVGRAAAGDIGIDIGVNASPTVINNIMAGFDTGLRVNGSAATQTTIVGGNIFRNNTTASNFPLGNSSFNLDLPTITQKALFEDINNKIYIPAAGSLAIDSSFASVSDRQAFFDTVKQPSGLGLSPIVAPSIDAYGQPRVDDPLVQTPAGVGANVFIDRGALDRADFVGPLASIAIPTDFITGQGTISIGGDTDGEPTYLRVPTGTLEFFEIQLLEPQGSGPNTATVLSDTVVLTENGRRLLAGIDYNFGYSASSNTIRLTPLSGIWRPDAAYEVTLNNRDRLVIQAPAGDGVVDGQQIVVTDQNGTRAFLEYETGFVLDIPQTLTLVVPAGIGGAAGFRDGDQFEITSPLGVTERFELNVFGDISSGVIEIPVAAGATASQVRDAIFNVLRTRTATLDIAPTAIGTNQIQIGSIIGHSVDTLSSPLTVIGIAQGVMDGDILRYRSGTTAVQFEFNLVGDTSTRFDSNIVIPFKRDDSYLVLAEKLAEAFRSTDFDLSDPRALGDGRVHLGGLVGDFLDTSATSIDQFGTPGVTDSLTMQVLAGDAGFAEGDQFAIIHNGITSLFELGFDRNVIPGAIPIRLVTGDTIDMVATRIVDAIQNAGIGLTPTNEGSGLIRLNEPFGYELDLLTFAADPTPSITSAGVPGGAVAVPIVPSPSLSPDGVAAQIVSALRNTPLVSRVFTPGGGSIWFANTNDVAGTDVVQVDAIRDLAGNRLQPNRANEETQYTILMPNVRLDFGDAPASYNTLTVDNGARNTLGGRGLPRLGRLIDTENDGQIAGSDDAGDLMLTVGGGVGALGAATADLALINAFVSSISAPAAADDGAQLIIQFGGQTLVFELDNNDAVADPSFIPVAFTVGMTATELTNVLASAINSSTSKIAARAQGTTLQVYGGDEDGTIVGQFTAGPGIASVQGLFYDVDGTFLSFLNPLDGAVDITVVTTGGGLLDAWIDFNGNGNWDDAGEQVFISQPVLDGRNRLRISTPTAAVDGLTWARFRLSQTGNQSSDGVAISGEVEDYQVRIASIAPPVPADDIHSIDEDNTLVVAGGASNVLSNDQIAALDPTSVVVLLEDDVRFGTLTLSANGDFVYLPDANYYGDDSFTYRIFGLAELVPGNPAAGLVPVRSSTLGTVNLTVNPINDVPLAVDKTQTVLEDFASGFTLTAAQLLVGALPANLAVVTEVPWDESDQSIRVTAIGNGTTSVSAPTGVGSESAQIVTSQGITLTANFLDGALVDVNYQPSNNYNFNNPLNPANPLPSLDSFTFTVTDNGRTVYADGSEIVIPEESVDATVVVTVDPVNDEPEFVFNGNQVSLEDSGPITRTIVSNLRPGPVNALDEVGQVVTFSLVGDAGNRTGLFSVPPTIDSNGVLRYTPALHQVGTVVYTVTAMDNGPNDPTIGDDPVADPVMLTITITPVNDAPEFTGTPIINVLEDTGPFTIPYATGVRPGPINAIDESGQQLTFIVVADPTNPAGLIPTLPTIDANGILRFNASTDAVGTARYSVTLRDNGGTANGGVDRSLAQTLEINVRPVNDAPRIIAGAPSRYTMLEDGVLVLPLTSPGGGAPAGLLDQFVVGPANEAQNVPGGNQTLSIVNFGSKRTINGRVETVVNSSGVVTELRYYPDKDYNSGPSGAVGDRIFYTVTDNGTTYNLASGAEQANPLTNDYQVELVVEPVNDEPTFNALTTSIRRLEDVGVVSIPGWATNIMAGPSTAGDETDPVTGQTITFSVTPAAGFTQTDISNLFSVAPTVNSVGTLSFTSAPNAVGTVVLIVAAVDSGAENTVRGDDRTSRPVTLTLTLAPVNDAPIASPASVNYALDEDRSIDIPLTNASGTGLYDIFRVGPANEGPGSTPGGNQTFATNDTLYPRATTGGGKIEPYFNGTTLVGLRYTPALDFNGVDSFVYGVRDNGQTFSLSLGTLVNDFRESYATVSLTVTAVNDRPEFAGGVDVSVLEDAGSENPALPANQVGISQIDNWATNILAGPATAIDENTGATKQAVTFEITYASGANPTTLFSELPTVDPATGQLKFKTIANANGATTFQVVAVDNGPEGFLGNDPTRPENLRRSLPRLFQIEVVPVNDAPTFTPGSTVGVVEDSGPYNLVWATNISPGPADEVAAGQVVLFDVNVLPADRAKFSVQPTISDAGILRFTPADDAYGTIVLSVNARDTAGAVSSPSVPLTINISPVNDAPVGVDDNLSGNEDGVLSIPVGALLGNDVDPDLPDDQLVIHEISATSLLGATITLSAANGSISYDPRLAATIQALRPGQTISDVFTYRARDLADALSAPTSVTITLTGINDAPVAVNDTPGVASTGSTTFSPLANDIDVDGTLVPSTIVITLQPAFGSLTVNASGQFIYTPSESFQGSDFLRYVVRDDLGAVSNQASVTITANDSPVAVNDFVLTYRNETVTFDPLANDSDSNGTLDASSVVILTPPTRGVAIVNNDGTITYQPNSDYFGNDSLTYQVLDNVGSPSNIASVDIRVVASKLQNPRNALDVNDSGQISPIDALLVINYLNRGGSSDINTALPGPPYYDVDGNQRITPTDALRVINYLNRVTGPLGGEGEAGPMSGLNGWHISSYDSYASAFAPGSLVAEGEGGSDSVSLDSMDNAWSWSMDDEDEARSGWLEHLVASEEDAEENANTLDALWSEFGGLE